MHVGLSLTFQNLGHAQTDADLWADETRLTDRGIALGYDGVWATEHHFTDYEITPEPLQFLTWVAGRSDRVKLGTMVVVLPWHDPIRVAEQAAVLDTLSNGRLTLAVGRGLGKVEFDAFGIPMEESRDRFIESTEIVLKALNTGVLSYDGRYYKIPERQLRPKPKKSFKGRVYAAAMSPESFGIMADFGVGVLVIAAKSWELVGSDVERYRARYLEANSDEAPPPITSCFVFCDRDGDRAAALAHEYTGKSFNAVISHYRFADGHLQHIKGYEHYAKQADAMDSEGTDSAVDEFRGLQVFGTPEQCLEKVMMIRELTQCESYLPVFKYGGMPYELAEKSMTLFAQEVMPKLQALGPPRPALVSGAAGGPGGS